MKKLGILYSVLVIYCSSFSQKNITTKTGTIFFEASIPAFEEVKGNNNNVSCVIKIATGEISTLAFITEFNFKMAMMQEHFNTNYLESHKYPKATFKGIIQGFNMAIIGNSPKEFVMTGKLSMHGKSKMITTIAMIQKKERGLQIATNFKVKTNDFRINIPKIIQNKIDETVTIKTTFLML